MSREERQQHARENTRRAILDAALELFIADGYAQVSIRNIAAKVEYSPGAIYSYFPSKEEIFFALAEEGFREIGERQFANAPSGDPLDDVRSVAWRLYEFSKDQPQYFALVFLDRHVPRVSREYERFSFISEMRSRALAQVERCIADGIFPATTHPEVALRLLFAPVIGIAALRLSNRLQPDIDADALVRDAIETTIAGIRAGAPTHARPSAMPDAQCPLSSAQRAVPKATPSTVRHQLAIARTLGVLALVGGLTSGCGTATGESAATDDAPAALSVSVAKATEQPITRFLKVTGTLAAEEEAEVAAEIQGRVIATPVERGTRVREGADLIRISAAEAQAQAAEAEANAAQLERRLGLGGPEERRQGVPGNTEERRQGVPGNTEERRQGVPGDGAFDIDRVPEVANARAQLTLAEGDFDRAKMLFEKQLLSQADFDQKSAQAEVARRQFEIARNGAMQQYQALLAARARVVLARKALADTVVRAPFAGVVGERLVSVGDYVTRGTKVASVLRTSPLRVELTVPEQYSAEVAVGRPVSFEVDASPGQKFTGQVRYVSPALEAASRTLVVEAVVPNDAGALKPGSFATALIEQASRSPGILTPAAAVRTVAGTARVFVVSGDTVEERIVTIGQPVGDLVEITSGLKAGERVATSSIAQLADGARVEAK
jgi:RND family efflux transporter MFP subunit